MQAMADDRVRELTIAVLIFLSIHLRDSRKSFTVRKFSQFESTSSRLFWNMGFQLQHILRCTNIAVAKCHTALIWATTGPKMVNSAADIEILFKGF